MNNKAPSLKHVYASPLLGLLICIYLLVLYLVFSYRRIIDFTPFYVSARALIDGVNPYPITKTLPANLNPPFFLCLFYPLGLLSYRIAIIIWSILSLSLGLIGAHLAFFYTFSDEFRKKYRLILYLLYFSFFPVLMDTSIVQVGSLLFFFIMMGYHFYHRNQDYLAGIFWGFIIAVKLFPALIFFYALKQGRYRVFFVMLASVLLASLIPLLIYGPTIYGQYLSLLSIIYWYGDSWNASFYGFIFRLMMDLKNPGQNLLPIEGLYLSLFFIFLLCYLKGMGPKEIANETQPINHQPFCLTLAMMVFMSPFGWLYYFTLLIFPLMLTGIAAFQINTKTLIPLVLWVSCFFLLDFPQAYILGRQMETIGEKIGLFSFSFYGLALLIILIISWQKMPGKQDININEIKNDEKKHHIVTVLLIFLFFSLAVPLNSFLMRLSMGGPGNYKVEDLDKLLKQDLQQ